MTLTLKQYCGASFCISFQPAAWDGLDNWPGIKISVCFVEQDAGVAGATAAAGADVEAAGAVVETGAAAGVGVPHAASKETAVIITITSVTYFLVVMRVPLFSSNGKRIELKNYSTYRINIFIP